MFKTTTITAIASAAQASIFWEKLKIFFDTPSIQHYEEVLSWQIAGLMIPLVAGPMRVAANILWSVAQDQSADYMKAYLYFYDIYDVDNFWGYFMDYSIYGKLYPIIGWETDFTEIDFAPSDILCYNLNGFDPDDDTTSIPTYSQTTEATDAGVTCDV